jgi:hypothetical protein
MKLFFLKAVRGAIAIRADELRNVFLELIHLTIIE